MSEDGPVDVYLRLADGCERQRCRAGRAGLGRRAHSVPTSGETTVAGSESPADTQKVRLSRDTLSCICRSAWAWTGQRFANRGGQVGRKQKLMYCGQIPLTRPLERGLKVRPA
jgi:hypothetical protein